MKQGSSVGYWDRVWIEFKKDSLAYVSLFFIIFLVVIAVFESFLAGNRPIVLVEEGKYYFPVVVDYPEFAERTFGPRTLTIRIRSRFSPR